MARAPTGKKPGGRRPGGSHQLRIIGGRWRGRRLSFGDAPGLRPTPDRVRETVFNWLQSRVPDARCLDLYAGSGALGLEAASRGAREVVLVDADARVCAQLRNQVQALEADNVEVIHMPAERYLSTTSGVFDIVFLDPPYNRGLLEPTLQKLVGGALLSERARVYLEAEAGLGEPVLPAGWILLRSKQAGEVGYHLAGPVDDAGMTDG